MPTRYSCHDGMCGAIDCPRCNPDRDDDEHLSSDPTFEADSIDPEPEPPYIPVTLRNAFEP